MVLKRSIPKGICDGHCDMLSRLPLIEVLIPSAAGCAIGRQLSALVGISSTVGCCLTQDHIPSLGDPHLMTDQRGGTRHSHLDATCDSSDSG